MEGQLSPSGSEPTGANGQSHPNYKDLALWDTPEYQFEADLNAICNWMDKNSITSESQVRSATRKEEWCASPISPINWQDAWAQNDSDPWNVSKKPRESEMIKPDYDPSQLTLEEYYERYPWDAPKFIFEGDMDVLNNQMEAFRITREARNSAKERLQKCDYPHFNRPKRTLFHPMTSSYKLDHEKPGQFEDADEKSPNQRKIGQPFQGKIRNDRRGYTSGNRRTSPY